MTERPLLLICGAFLLLILLHPELHACPGCAGNIEAIDADRAAGFGWSILLLISLPAVILSALALKVRRFRNALPLLLIPLMIPGAGGCGDEGEMSGEVADENLIAFDLSESGEIAGVVEFVGEVPQPERIEVAGDPYCGEGAMLTTIETQNVLVREGKLADVFVRVSRGLEGYRFEMPTDSALLDQKGCTYYPRVQGVRTGQPIIIRNSDPTIHNVHARPEQNDQFNIGQPEVMESVRSFSRPEAMIPITCDVHGWMRSYVGVVDHPEFRTTGVDGSFSFELPPGEYEVTAWHERYGELTEKIVVATGEKSSLTFRFGSEDKGAE